MLLFNLYFYSKHASTSTSSVCTVQCILPCMYVDMYFAESSFYSNHASVSRCASKNRLLFESCFYTGHASIQVMLLYATLQYVHVFVQPCIHMYMYATAREENI